MPPTSSFTSRPPVPMACEMPEPSFEMMQVTSCRPVPAAATTPMRPRGTTLAKASGTPLMMAVPQSGPMTSRPFLRANFLRATSVSSGTLSENSITWRPLSSACCATRPA